MFDCVTGNTAEAAPNLLARALEMVQPAAGRPMVRRIL